MPLKEEDEDVHLPALTFENSLSIEPVNPSLLEMRPNHKPGVAHWFPPPSPALCRSLDSRLSTFATPSLYT